MKNLLIILFMLICLPALAQDMEPDQTGHPIVRGVQFTRSGTTSTLTNIGQNQNIDLEANGSGSVTIAGKSTGGVTIGTSSGPLTLNYATASGFAIQQPGGTQLLSLPSGGKNWLFSTNAGVNGVLPHYQFASPADTGLAASTVLPLLAIGSSTMVTRQWATGTLADNPQELFYGIKDGFVGASTQTMGETLEVQQSDCGTNGTCSAMAGIYVPTRAFTGTVTNGYGIYIAAPTGAGTINSAAYFGGTVGIGTANPASELDVYGNIAIGTSYAGVTAAPTNGMIVQGSVAIGTSSATPGEFTLQNASAHAGQAACWTTGGAAGYCTTVVGSTGACTCTGL